MWELRRMWVRAQPDDARVGYGKKGDAYPNLKDLRAVAIHKGCCVWLGDFAESFIQRQIREC